MCELNVSSWTQKILRKYWILMKQFSCWIHWWFYQLHYNLSKTHMRPETTVATVRQYLAVTTSYSARKSPSSSVGGGAYIVFAPILGSWYMLCTQTSSSLWGQWTDSRLVREEKITELCIIWLPKGKGAPLTCLLGDTLQWPTVVTILLSEFHCIRWIKK